MSYYVIGPRPADADALTDPLPVLSWEEAAALLNGELIVPIYLPSDYSKLF